MYQTSSTRDPHRFHHVYGRTITARHAFASLFFSKALQNRRHHQHRRHHHHHHHHYRRYTPNKLQLSMAEPLLLLLSVGSSQSTLLALYPRPLFSLSSFVSSTLADRHCAFWYVVHARHGIHGLQNWRAERIGRSGLLLPSERLLTRMIGLPVMVGVYFTSGISLGAR